MIKITKKLIIFLFSVFLTLSNVVSVSSVLAEEPTGNTENTGEIVPDEEDPNTLSDPGLTIEEVPPEENNSLDETSLEEYPEENDEFISENILDEEGIDDPMVIQNIRKLNALRNAPSDAEGWTIDIVYFDIDTDPKFKRPFFTYEWNADTIDKRDIVIQVHYKNTSTLAEYDAEDITIEIPTFIAGRNGTYLQAENINDNNSRFKFKKYDEERGVYVFTNTDPIERDVNFEGTFQLVYSILPSDVYKDCEGEIQGQLLKLSEPLTDSNLLDWHFQTQVSTYYVSKNADAITPEGIPTDHPIDNYYWVQWHVGSGQDKVAPRGTVKGSEKLVEHIPEDAIVYMEDDYGRWIRKEAESDGTYVFTDRKGSFPLRATLLIAYPREVYNGQSITNTVDLYGTIIDDEDLGDQLLSTSSKTINLSEFEFIYDAPFYGITKSAAKSPSLTSFISSSLVKNNENGDTVTFYLQPYATYTEGTMDIEITDDVLVIPDTEGNYRILNDDEYEIVSIYYNFVPMMGANNRAFTDESVPFTLSLRYAGEQEYTKASTFKYYRWGQSYELLHLDDLTTSEYENRKKIVGFKVTGTGLKTSFIDSYFDRDSANGFISMTVRLKTDDIADVGNIYNFDALQVWNNVDGVRTLANGSDTTSYDSLVTKDLLIEHDLDRYDANETTLPQRSVASAPIVHRELNISSETKTADSYSLATSFNTYTSGNGKMTPNDSSDCFYGYVGTRGYIINIKTLDAFKGFDYYVTLPEGLLYSDTKDNILNNLKFDINTYLFEHTRYSDGTAVRDKYLNRTQWFQEEWLDNIVFDVSEDKRTVHFGIDFSEHPLDLTQLNYSSLELPTIGFRVELPYADYYQRGGSYTVNTHLALVGTEGEDYNLLSDGVYDDTYLSDRRSATSKATISAQRTNSSDLSIIKKVESEFTDYTKYTAYTTLGGDYKYKITVSSGSDKVTDLIIYDSIEHYAKDVNEEFIEAWKFGNVYRNHWFGQFNGFDLDGLRNLEDDQGKPVHAKFYYHDSYQPGPLDTDEGWKEYVEGETDKSLVHSIACEFLTEENQPAVFDKNSNIFIEIKMIAPEEDSKFRAYNGSYTTYTAIDESSGSPIYNMHSLPSNVVDVYIAPTVTKIWEDESSTRYRPIKITFDVRSGNYSGTVSMTSANSIDENTWQMYVPGYPRTTTSGNDEYPVDTVFIEKTPYLYTSTMTGPNVIHNKFTPIGDIPVYKIWDDENFISQRPESIIIDLYRQDDPDTVVSSLTMTPADATGQYIWEGKFENLPLLDDNENIIHYIYKERPVDNYLTKYTSGGQVKGLKITFGTIDALDSYLTITSRDTTTGKVYRSNSFYLRSKNNSNPSNQDLTEGSVIYIRGTEFYINSHQYYNSGSNCFGWEITNIEPIYDESLCIDSSPYNYRYEVPEYAKVFYGSNYPESDHYEFTHYGTSGFAYYYDDETLVSDPAAGKDTITNTINLKNVKITKQWDDVGYTDLRPESITIDLYAGTDLEHPIDTRELTSANAESTYIWSTTFENLPKYDENYNEIVYTVRERDIGDDYVTSYKGGDNKNTRGGLAFTIRNVDLKSTSSDQNYAEIYYRDKYDGRWYGLSPNPSSGIQLYQLGVPHHTANYHGYLYEGEELFVPADSFYVKLYSYNANSSFEITNIHSVEQAPLPKSQRDLSIGSYDTLVTVSDTDSFTVASVTNSTIYNFTGLIGSNEPELGQTKIVNTHVTTDFSFTKVWDDPGFEDSRPTLDDGLSFEIYSTYDLETPVKIIDKNTETSEYSVTTNGNTSTYHVHKLPKYNPDTSIAEYFVKEKPIAGYQTILAKQPTGLKITFVDTEYSPNYSMQLKFKMGNTWYALKNRYLTASAIGDGATIVIPSTEFWMDYSHSPGRGETFLYWGFKAKVEPVYDPITFPIETSSEPSASYDECIDFINTEYIESLHDPRLNTRPNYDLIHYRYDPDISNNRPNMVINRRLDKKVKITKIWEDYGLEDERPSEVVVDIYNPDNLKEIIETTTLTAENSTDDYTWQKELILPRFDADGQEITYLIEEHPVDGYNTIYQSVANLSTVDRTAGIRYENRTINYPTYLIFNNGGRWSYAKNYNSMSMPSNDFYYAIKSDPTRTFYKSNFTISPNSGTSYPTGSWSYEDLDQMADINDELSQIVELIKGKDYIDISGDERPKLDLPLTDNNFHVWHYTYNTESSEPFAGDYVVTNQRTSDLIIRKTVTTNELGVVDADSKAEKFPIFVKLKNYPKAQYTRPLTIENGYGVNLYNSKSPISTNYLSISSSYIDDEKYQILWENSSPIDKLVFGEYGSSITYLLWITPGETITIKGIPSGTDYEVTEVPYNNGEYGNGQKYKITTRVNTGTIEGSPVEVSINNELQMEEHSFTKRVTGYDTEETFLLAWYIGSSNDFANLYTAGKIKISGPDGYSREINLPTDKISDGYIYIPIKNGETTILKQPYGLPRATTEIKEYSIKEDYRNLTLDEIISQAERGNLEALEEITDDRTSHYSRYTTLMQPNQYQPKSEISVINISNLIGIEKTDVDGKLISGAQMQIIRKSDQKVVASWTTEKGKPYLWETVENDIDPTIDETEFILHEVTPPNGYDRAEDIEFTVTRSEYNGVVRFIVGGDDPGVSSSKVTMVDPRRTSTLSITKTVDGTMGSKDKEFNFTLQLTDDGDPLANYTLVSGSTNYETDADGKLTFTLKHGETLVLTRVPVGANYTVIEQSYLLEGYTTIYDNAEGMISDTVSENNVTVVNHRFAAVPTGIAISLLSGGLLVFIASVMLIRKKNRKALD